MFVVKGFSDDYFAVNVTDSRGITFKWILKKDIIEEVMRNL